MKKADTMHTNITIGGFEIENLRRLETPIMNGILEPHIYEGTLLLETGEQYCTWDKYGKCSNWSRKDCFIDVFNLYL